MPIDLAKALGAEIPIAANGWTRDQVILYHLGVGAGNPPTDPAELAWCYEGKLKVLPSFGVIPAFAVLAGLGKVPGVSFNPMMLLHGEQDLEIHGPIPVEASVTHKARVAALHDKGKAAVAVLEVETRDASDALLFSNRFSIFMRGEGGFGGESGPKTSDPPPDREPDLVVESPTLPQQALLYRLSGDKNPLHADPGFAKLGGFDRPILHGLCTFGVACKAAVDRALGGDPGRVARYRVRFAGVVFPGETIVTRIWREDGRLALEARTKERGEVVLSNASIHLR